MIDLYRLVLVECDRGFASLLHNLKTFLQGDDTKELFDVCLDICGEDVECCVINRNSFLQQATDVCLCLLS